ncbi:MAG: hypothetical protein K2L83_05330 [Muribaculaceae bacterium]|nr:hypothetical protein [Muribaculaceae bacterium]
MKKVTIEELSLLKGGRNDAECARIQAFATVHGGELTEAQWNDWLRDFDEFCM